ncbi:MAG: YgeY family selenium metabolism-linked hydrolase, partial [Thermotogaceae bacterium]|nr:YgeY family selenium metabolism-linked hydrolase [Thermotogaceae bacterium]
KSLSGREQEVVQLVEREMEKVGFDEVFIDGFGNVIGRVGDGKVKIAMDAHLDTVDIGNPDLWEKDPFSGDVDDEWVYGRGASDQKAGMASMVYGVKVMKALSLFGDFTLYVVGSVLEENCDGLCWKYIIENDVIKPDFVLITEPTGLNINIGQRGRVEFRIKTKGLSAHASAPERGENAIYKMAKIINEVEKLNESLKDDPFLGKGTIAVTQIFFKSPSQNAVPDECVIHIDRRLTKGETKESAYEEIREIFRKTGIDGEIVELICEERSYTGLLYSMEKYFPTWVTGEKDIIVESARKAYKEVFEKEPTIGKWTFSTNGVVTAGIYKIPTVGFGPGDEIFAHAPNEKVRISHLLKAAAFYAVFPKTLTEMIEGRYES